ncbi:MAG: Maf family protein [Oscillospiraceae bacterium]|nr:Maf family protein [Oscillospiraceae bacterium]
MKQKIVLASASPRRKELLHMLGMSELLVCPAKGDEHAPSSRDPEEIVRALASAKVREVAKDFDGDTLIIGADTIVWLDGRMLGKPQTEDEAFSMLKALSGRRHEVYTGLCVRCGGEIDCEAERSEVVFRTLSDGEIRRYIATGEPMDKAGAYGAQGIGALFVREIHGDFFNVMGLPLCRLGEMLSRKGVSIL